MANWTIGEVIPLKGKWYRLEAVFEDGQLQLTPTGKLTAGTEKRVAAKVRWAVGHRGAHESEFDKRGIPRP